MNEQALPRLCPRCFIVGPEPSCNTCGAETEAFGSPWGEPLVVGRLRLLDGPPELDDLTTEWPGSRRYPRPPQRPHTPSSFCRHWNGVPVWLWEAPWETAFTDSDSARVCRALAASGSLVLEAPAPMVPAFRARYAQQRNRRTLPEIRTLIDDLENALDYLNPMLRKIALVHPEEAQGLGREIVERLKRWCDDVEVFSEERSALSGCLPIPSRQRHRLATSGLASTTDGILKVGLKEMGGTLARRLLSRLHRITPSGRPSHGVQLIDVATKNCGIIRRLDRLKGLPPEVLPAPPWQGVFAHGWWRRTSVRLAMAESDESPVQVVAVGSNRLRGEQILAELLDQDYRQPLRPLVLLHADGHSDRDLLNWGQRELGAQTLAIGDDDLATVSELMAYLLPR